MSKVVAKFALLDVRDGRTELARRLELGEHPRVDLSGRITKVWSRDDGVSIAFEVALDEVVVEKKES